MTAAVLARALELFPAPIRTLDAIRLSTIEYFRNRRETVELASYDTHRRAAAQALGISIVALRAWERRLTATELGSHAGDRRSRRGQGPAGVDFRLEGGVRRREIDG
jgi:hypothetical protein